MQRLTYITTDEDAGRALGDVIRRRLGLSRRGLTHAKYLVDGILLDGVRSRANAVVRAGQVVDVALADADGAADECTVEAVASAEAASQVRILYEDDALVVADKPAGMVMYPGPAHAGDTLANVLLARARAAGHEGLIHPVHRLDAGTSGAVVFAYTGFVQHRLSQALHTEGFVREYVAFCEGNPADALGKELPFGRLNYDRGTEVLSQNGGEVNAFTVDAAIARKGYAPSVFAAVADDDPDGKPARTRFRIETPCIKRDSPFLCMSGASRGVSRVRLRLETGRTHQIRIHMALIGHPLLGDETYGTGEFAFLDADGAARTLTRPALHSACIALDHPITGAQLRIQAPLPEDLAALNDALGCVPDGSC